MRFEFSGMHSLLAVLAALALAGAAPIPVLDARLLTLLLGAASLSLLATPLPGRAVYSAAMPLWLQAGPMPALLGMVIHCLSYGWKGASRRQMLLEPWAGLAAVSIMVCGQRFHPLPVWSQVAQVVYAGLIIDLRWRSAPRDGQRSSYLRMQRSLRLLHAVTGVAALVPWHPASWPLWWSTHQAAAHQKFRVQAQLDEEFQQELEQLSDELAGSERQRQQLEQLTAARAVPEWVSRLGQAGQASARLFGPGTGSSDLIHKARRAAQPQFGGGELALPLEDGLVLHLTRPAPFTREELRNLAWLVRRAWPSLQAILRQGSLQTLLASSQQLAALTHQESLLRSLPDVCNRLVGHSWGLLCTVAGQLLHHWGSLPGNAQALASETARRGQPAWSPEVLGVPVGDWGVLLLGGRDFQAGQLHLLEVAAEQLSLAWQRAQALEQLRQYQQQLLLSGQMLAAGSLAAGVAHELNSPLGAISLMLDGARRHPANAAEKLERAQSACQRAKEIVNRLLQQALRPEEMRPFRLDDCLREGLRFVEGRLQQAGAVLTAVWSDNPTFQGRASSVQQVMINLLLNASEVSNKVELTTHPWGFSVRDHGPPVNDDVAARIFEPFYTTRAEGHGMGLWICQDLLAQQGGSIHLNRQRGTCFEVRLQPISEASANP